jgi:hypothetical protein
VLGIRTAHFRPAMSKDGNWITAVQGDGKGYPDLTLVGANGVAWRELKSLTGRTSPEQVDWVADLKAAGADADIWTPADLASGRIKRELRDLGRIAPRKVTPQVPRKVAAPSRKVGPAWLKQRRR